MLKPVRDEGFWQEGMDEKRFALWFLNKTGIFIAAALAGALFAGGIYLLVRTLTAGPQQYRAEVMYSIVYDIHEDDEVLKDFVNEYNAYTWGDMMRSDRIMADVLQLVPDVDRSVIEASVSTEIVSDPQFLTAYFTTEDGDLSNRIAAAYNQAMPAFGKTMEDRGLTAIEVWKAVPAQPVETENQAANAAALGLVLGIIAGIVGLCLWHVTDDTLLLGADVKKCCDLPMYGYRTRRLDIRWETLLNQNLTRCGETTGFCEVKLEDILSARADYEKLRKLPVLICAEWGTAKRSQLSFALDQLSMQGAEVSGIILEEADETFLRLYYGRGRKEEQG